MYEKIYETLTCLLFFSTCKYFCGCDDFFILVSPLSDGSPLLNEMSVFPPAVLANRVVALGCEPVKCHG